MGMDFRGLVLKQVWKKSWHFLVQKRNKNQDLENWATHPHQEFPIIKNTPWIKNSILDRD